jgi:Mycoplasma protein of unknown function, DUF285
MMASQPDIERAETAASHQQAASSAKGDVLGSDDAARRDSWRHGLSPLVAPGLCSPLAMMIMGFDDEEDDYWRATHRSRGGAFTADDEESKLESAASSAQLLLPVPTYCEPVEDLLFDRTPGAACVDALPNLSNKPQHRHSGKEKRVRFAIDYPDEIPMTTRTTTDEILLAAANAAAARPASPILANPCLSPSLPVAAPLSKAEEAALRFSAGPASKIVDDSNTTVVTKSLRNKKQRRRWSNHDDKTPTKDTYVMGKEEQPGWVRRNRLALVLIVLGLVLICAVAVPLATMSSSTSNPSPAIGTAANRTNNTSSPTNRTSVNGSWSEGDYSGTRGNRTDSGQNANTKKCFESNAELRAAMDTWLWASKLREEQQETPQALYELAGTYGWPMNNWCTSNVTNMSHLLSVDRNPLAVNFDQNISRWDVSSVRDFSYLFLGAASFSHDVSRWRVGRATRMDGMFRNATSYSHSLCEWGRRLVIGRGGGSVAVSVSVEQMFRGSGCRSTADPNLDAVPPSPLCAPCSSDDSRR